MFEGTVAYYLNNYLGKYVHGLDQNSLKISVFKGDVVLRNLKLKAEALADLDLPVSVKSGLIGSLTLKVRLLFKMISRVRGLRNSFQVHVISHIHHCRFPGRAWAGHLCWWSWTGYTFLQDQRRMIWTMRLIR